VQLGIFEPPDFEWEKPIVAGEDDDLVAVVNVRAQRHLRRVLGSGLRSGRRGLGPRRTNSLWKKRILLSTRRSVRKSHYPVCPVPQAMWLANRSC